MSNIDSIAVLMKKDHGKIRMLVDEFQSQVGVDQCVAKDYFTKLKWELERHFVVEEKAIFMYLDNVTKDCIGMKERLLGEHITIMDMIEKTFKCYEAGEEVDVDELILSLKRHAEFEDDQFYPRLDKELDAEKKREIVMGMQSPIGSG